MLTVLLVMYIWIFIERSKFDFKVISTTLGKTTVGQLLDFVMQASIWNTEGFSFLSGHGKQKQLHSSS